MTRQTAVTQVHAFEDDGTTDWRGQKVCHRCSLPKDIDRHTLPEVPPEVSEVEARRLGETP